MAVPLPILGALLLQAASASDVHQPALFKEMLSKRSSAVKTLSAIVMERSSAGPQFTEYVDRMALAGELLKEKRPERANEAKSLADRSSAIRKFGFASNEARYRCLASEARFLRIEELFGKAPVVSIFADGLWTNYQPPHQGGPSSDRLPAAGRMHVSEQAHPLLNFRVMAGLAIPVESFFPDTFHLSDNARKTGAVEWPEVFVLCMNGELEIAHEATGATLAFTSSPLTKVGLPLYRFKVFLDRKAAFLPAKLVVEDLVMGIKNVDPYYRTVRVMEWAGYGDHNGILTPTECRVHGLTHFSDVRRDRSPDEWRPITLDIKRMVYVLSEMRVNEAMDAAQFKIEPALGSSVTDRVKSETYVVGSAGEALNKTAIAALDQFGDPVRPTPWLWYGLAGVAALAAALAFAWRRRTQRRAVA